MLISSFFWVSFRMWSGQIVVSFIPNEIFACFAGFLRFLKSNLVYMGSLKANLEAATLLFGLCAVNFRTFLSFHALQAQDEGEPS
jgi:hypothetical protein